MGSPITAWAAKPYLRTARSTPSLQAGRVSPELMTSARVLVTGGAGFLSSHLCDALLAEGYSVIAVDNLLTGKASNLDHLARESRFELQQIDICEPFHCGKVECVFHLASPARPVQYCDHGYTIL